MKKSRPLPDPSASNAIRNRLKIALTKWYKKSPWWAKPLNICDLKKQSVHYYHTGLSFFTRSIRISRFLVRATISFVDPCSVAATASPYLSIAFTKLLLLSSPACKWNILARLNQMQAISWTHALFCETTLNLTTMQISILVVTMSCIPIFPVCPPL